MDKIRHFNQGCTNCEEEVGRLEPMLCMLDTIQRHVTYSNMWKELPDNRAITC